MSTFLSGGGPAVKFENVGDTFEGVVQSINEMVDRDQATGRAKIWDDGTPMKVWAFNCDPIDGGEEVTLWVRGNLVKATRVAAREAKVKDLVGCTIKVRHHELGQPKPGKSPAKLYQVRVTPGTPKATNSFVQADEEDPF